MKIPNSKFAALFFIFLLAGTVWSVDFYVSPEGNNNNPGTITKPFGSLEDARDAIRISKQSSGLPGEGVTVWIQEGTYSLSQTFELLEEDSGTEQAPIAYRAYKDEKVRIIGGKSIPSCAFKSVTDPAILKRFINDSVRKNVLQADLKALGITDYGKHAQYGHMFPVVPAPLELFFNHKVMTLARYPNNGTILIGKIIDPGSKPRIGDYSNRGGTFEYTDSRHSRWTGIDDIWLQGTFRYGYWDDKIKVESIDTETKQIKLAMPHAHGLAAGKSYHQYVAINILDEIDMPGEWYVDRNSGILYFWPPEDIKNANIEVSMLEEPLIALENVSYTTLKDLTIEVGRGIGIYTEGGQNNQIADCIVRNIGTSGILMGQGAKRTVSRMIYDAYNDAYDGVPVSRRIGDLENQIYKYTTWDRKAGKNHHITGCHVYDTGCGGIYLSGGSKKELIRGNSSVTNCRIHDYNRRNRFHGAGINVDGCGNTVAQNEIYNSDFHGIYVRGNEHLFEYNNIHHVAQNSDDTSAWYIGRDPSDRGNIIRYNFFHHVGKGDKMVMGVYVDDGSCGAVVFGNVFYKVATRGSVYSNAGHDLTVENNIFIESYGPAVELSSMWYSWAIKSIDHYFNKKDGIYVRRLKKQLDIKQPPYSTHYPELTDWLDLMDDGETIVGMRPRRNVMKNNVIVNCPETLKLMGEYAQFENKNNFETTCDPGFVDAKKMNFQLRDDSIVYEKIPGFQKIPFDKIGIVKLNRNP